MVTKHGLEADKAKLIERLNRHGEQLYEAKAILTDVATWMNSFPVRHFVKVVMRNRINALLSK